MPKCGNIKDAYKIFGAMVEHDLISCNAMICGYAAHGLGNGILILFNQMKEPKIEPWCYFFRCLVLMQ